MDLDESRYIVFHVDEEELRALERAVASGDRPQLLEPLTAARAYGEAYGLPASTQYEILEASGEPEEGAGAFIALVRATNDHSSVVLRLVSQPDQEGRSTFWVINDLGREADPDDPR